MAPTSPPSTTRGTRTCQTMFHSVVLTPLSMWIPGTWSSSATGTRHQVGPAGPIMIPDRKAVTTPASAITAQRTPCPDRGTSDARNPAGTAWVAAVPAVCSASAGGDGDLLESIVDLLGVLDDPR